MSVLVYIESENGKFKKASYEAASYAKGVADQLGSSVTAVTINAENNEVLGTYGVSKVLQVNNDQLSKFNADAYADVIAQAAKNEDVGKGKGTETESGGKENATEDQDGRKSQIKGGKGAAEEEKGRREGAVTQK